MSKRFLTLGLMLAILASGCVTVRIETVINENGSGTKSFLLALDKSVMSMIESMAGEAGASTDDIWEDARAGAASINGAMIEDYSDDDVEGIKISVPFNSLDELEALSNSDAFEGADSVTVSQDGDTTTLLAVVDVGEVTAGLDEAGQQGLEDFDLGDIELEYTYVVEVEGEILDYAPTDIASVDGNRVSWNLTQSNTDSLELMVKWQPGGGGLDVLVLLLIVAVVAGLVLVVAGAFFALRGQRASVPTPVEPNQT